MVSSGSDEKNDADRSDDNFCSGIYFSGIIQEIENKMSRAGYGIQISITNNSVEKERFILKSILDKKRVDGIMAEPTKEWPS